jgi:endonuclease YncB( thermonuclease family)
MKSSRLLAFLTMAPLLAVPFAGGCVFLKAPEPIPTPTPVPAPTPPYFDPAAGQPRGTALNKAGDPVMPDAFRIAGATTGDLVAIQTVDTVKTGTPPRDVITLGPPDTVRLAGIVAPSTEPGLQGAKNAITNWTAGQNVDVDVDAKYPLDLDGRRMVQVFFKGRKGPYEGQQLSLNRMLVRSGWAVVDLYSPTSFDTSEWLADEAYARRHKLGFWKYGQAPQQRVPVKVTANTRGKSNVIVQTARPGQAPATQTTSQTTTSQTTTSQTTASQTTASQPTRSRTTPSQIASPATAPPASVPPPTEQ